MKLYVNGTTLNVNNAWTEREESNGIITLLIKVPYAEIEHDDLKNLFKNNTEDMIKTADDGTEETFTGEFSYKYTTDNDASEIYTVVMTVGENAHQLGRNRQLEKDNADLNAKVASKDNEIATLNTAVAEKDTEIAEKTATIEVKEDTIAEQGVKITELEATIVSKDEEITAKDLEIAELLTIAEEYADMLYAEAIEEMETVVDEPVIDESEVF